MQNRDRPALLAIQADNFVSRQRQLPNVLEPVRRIAPGP
jgi:hypothetical protein